MVLAVDVGNSNIVLGGYAQGKLRFMSRLATDLSLEADQYAVQLAGILKLHGVENEPLDRVVIATVVPSLTPVLRRSLAYFTDKKPHFLTLQDAGDVTVDIENPRELGMDILASALAVRRDYSLPAVIIDMGTATKLTALDAEGRLRGVAISPGLFLSLRALVQGTSTLGGISLEAPEAAIGRNTAESMKSGVVLGAASMLDGMIDRFAEEMGGLATVVATGGAAPVVAPHCKHRVQVSDTLLLDGLCRVAESDK